MRQMEHHAIAIAGEVWTRAGENDEINEKYGRLSYASYAFVGGVGFYFAWG